MKHSKYDKTSSNDRDIHIIHNMARSGGTLICKCIGCMDRILLLSEIHPLGTSLFNPLKQANEWFHLLKPKDVARLKNKTRLEFVEAISLIDRRCRQRGKTLVLRDWAHLDFTGIPFLQKPPYRFLLSDALRERFTIHKAAIVRHPVDQWLSLRKLAIMQGKISLPLFLKGYRKYAEKCADMDYIKYEDFTEAPEALCARLCQMLHIDYDPEFIRRWMHYKTITGEVTSARAGDRRIAPVPRRPLEPGLMEAFEQNSDYQEAIRILGYPSPHVACSDHRASIKQHAVTA